MTCPLISRERESTIRNQMEKMRDETGRAFNYIALARQKLPGIVFHEVDLSKAYDDGEWAGHFSCDGSTTEFSWRVEAAEHNEENVGKAKREEVKRMAKLAEKRLALLVQHNSAEEEFETAREKLRGYVESNQEKSGPPGWLDNVIGREERRVPKLGEKVMTTNSLLPSALQEDHDIRD